MIRRFVLGFLLISVLVLGCRAWGSSRSASTTVMISARVDRFAEWADVGPIVLQSDWPAINKVGQSRIVSKALTLYTNTDAVITAQPGQNDGVLTLGSQTLNTAYRVSGKVTNPDSMFKPAGTASGEFFNSSNEYHVAHEMGVGTYPIELDVQVTSPTDTANEPGVYSCSVILTAAW